MNGSGLIGPTVMTIIRRVRTTIIVLVWYPAYGGFLGLLCGLGAGVIAYRYEPWAILVAPAIGTAIGASYFERLTVDRISGDMRFGAYLLFVKVRTRHFSPGDRIALYRTFAGTEGIVIAERTPRETVLSTNLPEQVMAVLEQK